MACPWWLLKAGQCRLQLFILKSLLLAFFSFHRIGAREMPSPGTIMWISALIAWLRFANGVCSNNYTERVTTDAKKKDFSPLNYCSDFPGKAEVWILRNQLRAGRIRCTEHLQLLCKHRRGFRAPPAASGSLQLLRQTRSTQNSPEHTLEGTEQQLWACCRLFSGEIPQDFAEILMPERLTPPGLQKDHFYHQICFLNYTQFLEQAPPP